ncbi:MAG: hypothetical protein M0C28_13355 [Candidatus Moduliflexus flocculans]|nr:hypothetical protein [Candidatus Moduliflexus flocculans]
MKARQQGLGALRLLVGQRHAAVHRCSELVELGVSWVWMGLESPTAELREAEGHRHASTLDAASCSRTASACSARPSSAWSTTRRRTSRAEIEHAVRARHRLPPVHALHAGPRHAALRARWWTRAGCCRTWTWPTSTGRTSSTSSTRPSPRERVEDAARLGLPARLRDATARASTASPGRCSEGWQKLSLRPRSARAGAHPRCRARTCAHGYGAALFAMERYLQRVQRRRERGRSAHCARTWSTSWARFTRWADRAAGPVLLWLARRDARKHPHGQRHRADDVLRAPQLARDGRRSSGCPAWTASSIVARWMAAVSSTRRA